MNLSIQQLTEIPGGAVQLPDPKTFELPEKVLQFGTGVLLRGLPDYFIDQANREGKFGGRIVVVKSTGGGDADAFSRQDGLYTVCIRGLENGHKVSENWISSAISRVLQASDHWPEILKLAASADLQVIISNTTEVGIQLVKEDVTKSVPPYSFPGKLLAFLYARFQAFGGSSAPGLVIIPTELISDNGGKLRAILGDLARFNRLDGAFLNWLDTVNIFCNSLVDRIVPGRPDAITLAQLDKFLGYQDDLLLICEAYRFWAIEGDESLHRILGFASVDPGVVIAPDIEVFKELKLRLLNGTHTLCCGLAFLSGFDTVRDAMEDEAFEGLIEDLMLHEIAEAIPVPIQEGQARSFGHKVLERFRNPYLEHRWINITLQYTSKMRMRVVPVLLRHYQVHHRVPKNMAKGWAGYLLFMKPARAERGKLYGESRGIHYPIQDDLGAVLQGYWGEADPGSGTAGAVIDPANVARRVLADTDLWGSDLTALPGFLESVSKQLQLMIEKGGI